MSQINIAGDTSGSIAVVAPLVAGSNTITLPASTGTVLTSVSPASDLPSSIKGPAFSAYLSSSMGSISSGVDTKITYQSKDFDTGTCYNNTGSTVTLNGISVPAYSFAPNVAGYYQINAVFRADNSPTREIIYLYKNGSFLQQGNDITGSAGVAIILSTIVYANGTSDYFAIYGYATGSPTVTSTSTNRISACLLRSA